MGNFLLCLSHYRTERSKFRLSCAIPLLLQWGMIQGILWITGPRKMTSLESVQSSNETVLDMLQFCLNVVPPQFISDSRYGVARKRRQVVHKSLAFHGWHTIFHLPRNLSIEKCPVFYLNVLNKMINSSNQLVNGDLNYLGKESPMFSLPEAFSSSLNNQVMETLIIQAYSMAEAIKDLSGNSTLQTEWIQARII